MRVVLAFCFFLGLVALAALWWLKFESHAPQAKLSTALAALGRKSPIDVDVTADGPGLRRIALRLRTGETTQEIFSQEYPAAGWRGSLIHAQHVHAEPDLVALKLPEGKATLEIEAETYAWHAWPKHGEPILTLPLEIDLTPPQLTALTSQHNLRLGGVDLAVWRLSADAIESHIEVERYVFPGYTGYFSDSGVALGFFAIPQDLDVNAQPRLVAVDAAGNRREVQLPVNIKPRRFADRSLPLDDAFLSRKVPEIEQANGLPASSDLVQGYLQINRELRKQNEKRIREVTAKSVPRPLWDGTFHRQTNAAPLSSFADRRTYTYHNEVIDHQTHLGFDLASLKLSDVEAAQNGQVAFSGNLGIYGNTVILDHGLGIFTLYGHLSSQAVHEGEKVRVRQTIGQTGETGLAGGDHLHFSIMLHGVHVDPIEWWDPHWLKDHVNGKLAMFPRAAEKSEANEQSQP